MATQFSLTMKPGVQRDIRALPVKHRDQIYETLARLEEDPLPDGRLKQKLKGYDGAFRVRSGDYRIIYTLTDRAVGVTQVIRRNETTYAKVLAPKMPAIGDIDLEVPTDPDLHPDPVISVQLPPPPPEPDEPLPTPITSEILSAVGIPEDRWPGFQAVEGVDQLLALDGVHRDHVEAVVEVLWPKSLEERMVEPDLVVANGVGDIRAIVDGEIDVQALLLELDKDQERFVRFALDATGPVLVRGGPGTGKSTVALYRAQALMEQIREREGREPRILFTTYTNALVAFSRALLDRLLGPDAALVEVATCDQIIGRVHEQLAGKALSRINSSTLENYLEKCRSDLADTDQAALPRTRTLERLGVEYLAEEINQVLYGRGVRDFANYQRIDRTGRREGLTRDDHGQRWHVWQLKDQLESLLARYGKVTYSQGRAITAGLIGAAVANGASRGQDYPAYDAVIVDEAQDLDPVALAVLIELVPHPNRLFVAADANQAIFRSGFDLSGIHPRLDFTGRIGVLERNYRTTAPIAKAATSYLTKNPDLEVELDHNDFALDGPPPAAVKVRGGLDDEALVIADHIMSSARELRVPVGSSAVFAHTKQDCRGLAGALTALGMPAAAMDSKSFDPSINRVKVMPFKGCKGLEFPIVCLGGFTSGSFPHLPTQITDEARHELYERERRLLYVAMTRAMRRLTVVLPHRADNSLLHGFDSDFWTIEELT